MKLMLTNVGHRHLADRFNRGLEGGELSLDEALVALIDVRTRGSVPAEELPLQRQLLRRGLLQEAPPGATAEELELRYQRNPLEHITRVIFEYTSRCNFSCRHCYNATVERHTEADPRVLCRAVDLFALMGVSQFDFIGGEVTRFGDGWLEVARHAATRHEAHVTVTTNGWWLERQGFAAAGRTYSDDAEYLAALQRQGVSHVLFSVDGTREQHDRSRGHPGLYDRVMAGFGKARRAGISPQVSLLVRGNQQLGNFVGLGAGLARRLYGLDDDHDPGAAALRLSNDPFNKLSSLIDVGSHAGRGGEGLPLEAFPPEVLRCKGFFRPHPSLTIKASGEVSTCRITDAGEGYGNIHDQDLAEILNTMQDRFIFRLHAEGRVQEYIPLVDVALFGETYSHACSARAVLTLLALRMEQQGVDPGDAEGLARVNRQVARETGHLTR